MHTSKQPANAATFVANTNRTARTPVLLRILNWLAERDEAYRMACKLRDMPDVRLKDMGLTRQDANRAFQRGHDG